MGRPSSYKLETAQAICDLLAEGIPLHQICKREGMPCESTVRAWNLDDVGGFSAMYARARQLGYERLAEEILDISDDSSGDVMIDKDGNELTDHERIARSKLRVDSRKWLLSKMLPKTFGDRLAHTGADGGSLVVTIKDYTGRKPADDQDDLESGE